MAVFKIGDRVRIRSLEEIYPEHWGKCGTIESLPGMGGAGEDYGLSSDGIGDPGAGFVGWRAPGWALEPIQPDRNQIVEWSACEWQPEHLREAV